MVRLLPTWGELFGYRIYFWSREDNEPIHVHVCKGKPSENSAKFWIHDDEIILEHNKAGIPANDLKKIQKYISLNKKDIIYEWYKHFMN